MSTSPVVVSNPATANPATASPIPAVAASQVIPQVTAPASATTPTPAAKLVAPTPASQPTIDPTDTDEGLTAHTQQALAQAPAALTKWLDIPNIKATKQAIPDDAEDYTGGRLPQSGVKQGDTSNIGVYNGANYAQDADGNKNGQFAVHEATHLVQNMLPKSFTDKFPAEDPKAPYKVLQLTSDDLSKMRQNGDTLWNHSREGQASLLQNYTARQEWLKNTATPQQRQDYLSGTGQFTNDNQAKFEAAYAPYLQDLANAPIKKKSPLVSNAKSK
jgi:hypothetical protein